MTINETGRGLITATDTIHYARTRNNEPNDWTVSWLPGRWLSREQAVAAITLADLTADRGFTDYDAALPKVKALAELVGVDVYAAERLIIDKAQAIKDRAAEELAKAGVVARRIGDRPARPEAGLYRIDRELLDIWEQHGIPDDPSTHEHALDLVLRLWAEHKRLRAEVDSVVGSTPEASTT